jgi:citrate lyase subunit beta/citryl-CoA lyase
LAVMRSILYVPANSDRMLGKAASLSADIVTLDLEDSVPPAEKAKARQLAADRLKEIGKAGSEVYVRLNAWETLMTDDDLEAVVHEGLEGVTLAKCGHPDEVRRLDWKLDELERRRGLTPGSIKISVLLETARGVIHAYHSCMASSRVVSAIFGAVDFTKDMRVKLTSEGEEQKYARRHVAVAARAAGVIAIYAPFVAFQDMEAFEANVRDGRQMGFEGRMIIHPSQIPVCNRMYAPDPDDVAWAADVVKAFEEEGIAKGKAAIPFNGKMIDTPVYLNAKEVLLAHREIEAKNAHSRADSIA